jgi:SAM-dependent methyltransferase
MERSNHGQSVISEPPAQQSADPGLLISGIPTLDPAAARSASYYTGVRFDVVSLLPTGLRSVLEVGCAAGGTGRLLRSMGVERLIGVELNPVYAAVAREHYSEVFVGDAETLDLGRLEKHSLDCIIYCDVLEHFHSPWSVLRRHMEYLRPEGFVAASIPNIRYYKAVQDLVLHDKWEYTDAGILDRGHLRFFTLRSIQELFRETGLEIVKLEYNRRGSFPLKLLNKILLNRLSPFLVKQYLVLARKSDPESLSE